MKAEFEKVNPDITVNFVRMSSGESLARLRSEKENPQFDIWWGGPIDSFVAATQDGLLEPYDSPNLANLINPDLMKDPDNHWAGVYVGSLGFATNQNWLDENPGVEPPRSWNDLLKPEFTGQIMVAHPSSSGTSYTAICTILQIMGEEEGWNFINQYADQVLQFTKSGAAPASFVGQGEAAVGIVFSHDTVAKMERGCHSCFPSQKRAQATRSAAWALSRALPIRTRPRSGSTGPWNPLPRNWGRSMRPSRRLRSMERPLRAQNCWK